MKIMFVILIVYLLVMSICDIKTKRINLCISIVTFAVLFVMNLYLTYKTGRSITEGFSGMLVGVFVILVSYVTRGQVGMGDGVIFLISGLCWGAYENGILLLISLVMTSIIGMSLVIIRRKGRHYRLPFVPFVCVGFGVMCLCRLLA